MSNTFDYILRHFIMLTIYHWGVEGMKMWRSTFGQQHGQQCWLMYNISKFTDFLSLKEFVRKNIFLSNFHSKFQMRIESSFLRTIWTRPTVRFEIWNLQIKLVIDWKNTRFVPYKVLAWRTNYVFFIFITIDPTPFPFSASWMDCKFLEILHLHNSSNIFKFLHLAFPMLDSPHFTPLTTWKS